MGSVSAGRSIVAPGGGAVGTRVLLLEVGAVLAGPVPGATVAVEEVAELADGTPVTVDGLAPANEDYQGFWFLVGPPDSEDETFWTGFLRSLRAEASAACAW